MKKPGLIEHLRRAIRRHRRLLAALAAAIAVYAGLISVRAGDAGVPVLTAVRAIPAGTALAAADMAIARWPPGIVPVGALTDLADAVGHTTVAAVPAGDIVARSDLLDGGSLVNDGFVALPVRFGSGAPLELLRVGDRIDLIGTAHDGQAATVLVSQARVVALPEDAGSVIPSGGGVVLVEVTPAQAATLTEAASLGSMSFALR